MIVRLVVALVLLSSPASGAGLWRNHVLPGQVRCSDLADPAVTPVSVTTSDNLQTKIGEACSAGPGIVELAAGTYTDRNIQLGTDGQAIGGRCIIRAANPAAKPLIRATIGVPRAIFQAKNVAHQLVFQNLALDGRRSEQTSGAINTPCTDTTPADGICDGPDGQNATDAHGIYSRDVSGVTPGSICVLGVDIINTVGDAITVRDQYDSAVEDTTATGFGCDPTSCPLLGVPEDYRTDSITTVARGVNWVDSYRVMVVDSTFSNGTKQGIQCFNAYDCYSFQNTISDIGLAGITMLGSDGVVMGNDVSEVGFGWAPNTTTDNTGIGISVIDGTAGYNFDVEIKGNVVTHTWRDGIQLGLSTTNTATPTGSVVGNTVTTPCDGSTATTDAGITMGDNTDSYASLEQRGNTIVGSSCASALRVSKPTAYTGSTTTISGTLSGKGIIYDDAPMTEATIVTDEDIEIDAGSSGTMTGCTLNSGAVVTDASAGAVVRSGGC